MDARRIRVAAVALVAFLFAAVVPAAQAREWIIDEDPNLPSTLARSENAHPPQSSGGVLSSTMLVTWYGNPHTGLMGVLGQYTGEELATRLKRQADAYVPHTDKQVVPAYELIAVVAQDNAGEDGKWRRREFRDVIQSMLDQARAHGFKLILDVQVGHSTVEEELEYLLPYLKEPDVYLALDPEFDMWPGQTPGMQIGHMTAKEINYAIRLLDQIIADEALPPKVLIVHQFTLNMLPDKENITHSAQVDVALVMDGFGAPWLKKDTWNMVMAVPLSYAGIKMFYDQDPDMFTPEQVMGLSPVPSVAIYQ